MWIPIAVAVIGLICTAVFVVVDQYDRFVCGFFGVVFTALTTLVTAVLVDRVYSRNAFAAITACESRRMEARRQALTTNVVCVPAYRETKNDTTTVNLNTKP